MIEVTRFVTEMWTSHRGMAGRLLAMEAVMFGDMSHFCDTEIRAEGQGV